jgi:2'-deoxynucleoside 5'-phosphate N-hydrolase
MKIYFSGSIRGGRDDKEIYLKIIGLLQEYGEVLTEHIGDKNLTDRGEVDLEDTYIYERDMAWLRDSDVIVADVSTPSVGVGYEIAYGETLGKKILCLYREGAEKRISGMIGGNKNLLVKNYTTVAELPEILKEAFAKFT